MDKKLSKLPEWDLRINFKCNDCGSFLPKAGELVPHSVEKHCSNKYYWCFVCKTYSTDKKPNLIQHFRDKHGLMTDFFACPLCYDHHANDDEEMESHIIRDHWSVKQVYCCNLCSYKCENSIAQHIQNSHKGKSCTIPGCSFKPKNTAPAELFQHMLASHLPRINVDYCCKFCDIMFGSEKAVLQHYKDKHGIGISSIDEDDISIEIHCTLCENYKCEKKDTFYKHMKTKHNLIVFNCPFHPCSFSTDKFWKFSEHVSDEHISKVSFRCPKCSTNFSKEKALKQHIEDKHIGDLKPYCLCKFFAGSPKNHLETFHGIIMETEICRLCGALVNDNDYNSHMKNHGIDFPKGIEELYDEE